MALFKKIRQKTYTIPTLYCLSFLLFSVFIHWLNLNLSAYSFSVNVNLFQPVVAARSILSIMTASLLSMITVSFSTIMVVLTLYSAQFSPKTLQNFLQSKTSLHVLGFFMGVFIYAVSQLYLVQDTAPYPRTLSASLGLVLTIASLIVFAYFIHHVASSIQVHLLVEGISRDIFSMIRQKNKPCAQGKDCPQEKSKTSDPSPVYGEISKLYAPSIGYIQEIDTTALVNYAKDQKLLLRLEQSLGDYITEETVLFSTWPLQEKEGKEEDKKEGEKRVQKEEKEEGLKESREKSITKENLKEDQDQDKRIEKKDGRKEGAAEDTITELFEAVTVGQERNAQEDIEYGLIKLVEVALRAVSPGINDPNTAVLCIQKIGYILADIARTDAHRTFYYQEDGALGLIVHKVHFSDLLYQSFSQLKVYAFNDYIIVGAALDALIEISKKAPDLLKKDVKAFADYLLEGLALEELASLDRQYIEAKIRELNHVNAEKRS